MNAPPPNSVVLLDTNAIEAAHSHNCWKALARRYQLHTVAMCIAEATRQNKRGKRLVNREPEDLASDFKRVADVSDIDQARLMIAIGNRNDVDDGERDLLAYARTLPVNAWWLCGPDNGTVFAMRILKMFDRMTSLETLAAACGARLGNLPYNYTKR